VRKEIRADVRGCHQLPGLLLVGEVDLNRLSTEFAGLFHDARLVIQPDAGHSPWLDDAGWFVAAVSAFLDEG
jgi:pimeloyl-ACP methyl ester carboxylesterase